MNGSSSAGGGIAEFAKGALHSFRISGQSLDKALLR